MTDETPHKPEGDTNTSTAQTSQTATDNFGDQLAQASPEAAAGMIETMFNGADPTSPSSATTAAARFLGAHQEVTTLLELIDPKTIGLIVDQLIIRLHNRPAADDLRAAEDLLDAVRLRPLRRRIAADGKTREWADRLTRLIEASNFTFPKLFRQRAERHPSRTLFIVPGRQGARNVTWRQAAGRVDLLARGLIALTRNDPETSTIAILSRNRLEMALTDLACLTSGLVNVMIPATATEADITYILDHSKAGTVVVSSRDLLERVLSLRGQAPGVRRIISLDGINDPDHNVIPLEAVMELSGEISRSELEGRRSALGIDDRVSVMYTSGTTGIPKGICFTHRNIVCKRFHRALALPEIGEGDRFLSYLPLFHTFGRYFEMTGSIFWGASYVFAENPAIETLMLQMQQFEPSVFISIPMKWMQLYDAVRAEIDIDAADDDAIGAVIRRLTGGNLRWGLSAAGYLDPDIFRFFQHFGIELMSGFGMTEGTGGMTMTPPGHYREDSLGPALPGIEISLADDGELLVRGPYVMEGYLDPPEGIESFDADGWFHTGDLMEMSSDGFIRIIDRKKEIYKNVKGQTVAPQKIENLFRDFDSIGRVFLVGDHRPYNTALIYANPEFEEVDLNELSTEDLRAHFRSLVITANTFLSPFERIVDFAVIDRDFDESLGELTPKNTFRRKTIERNFTNTIRKLYQRMTLTVGGIDVTVPNWVFQALGVTAQDLTGEGDALRFTDSETVLKIQRISDTQVRVGPVLYDIGTAKSLNLGTLLSVPRLWLGNEALVTFAPLEPEQRAFKRRRLLKISWNTRLEPYAISNDDRRHLESLLRSSDPGLVDLHRAALVVESPDTSAAVIGLRCLEHMLETSDSDIVDDSLVLLRRASRNPSPPVVRRAFQVLAAHERGPGYRAMITRFLDALPDLFDTETTGLLAERTLSEEQLDAFFAETENRWTFGEDPSRTPLASSLLAFLAEYGAHHPTSYRRVRAFITRAALTAPEDDIRAAAGDALDHLRTGFRSWLGSLSRIAVDPETGFEYRWDDVVAFADDVDEEARDRLLGALRSTPMLREGIFLFSRGASVSLSDILPGGVWIRHLGTDHGKSVYRIAVKTRSRDHHDLAVNLNRDLEIFQVAEEIDWLVVCGSVRGRGPLVEEFGGWWPDHGLWTEEFIGGDTLNRALKRLARRPDGLEQLENLWPHAAWAALAAYVDFWDRTGRRLEVADPSPANVTVPLHDYQTDARLVSIASRRAFSSVASMLLAFKNTFVDGVETEFPSLEGLVTWALPCSALLEIVGEEEGVTLLNEALADPSLASLEGFRRQTTEFLASVAQRGFLPRRLFFAAKRFRRWARLNPDATALAAATTLQEIYSTYGLQSLQESFPEARARFFRETVFRDAPTQLAEGLEKIIARLRARDLEGDELGAAVADLRAYLSLDKDDDSFLARLSYPHLRPEDEALFVPATAGGGRHSEMVVTYEDTEGDLFRIRHAISAKEVGRLHRLFLAAKLSVQFRREHRFLVAVNDRGRLIGGLFYEVNTENRTAHMDKIVISEHSQGRGIAGRLLEELCNRMRSSGATSITTGFFRPQFFYRYGFTIEKRYAGLVRRLDDSPENEG
jgi:long-subunit acyl-CoA synthetase (AMP-forming)/N-acetylglutamate synthase-like GNAT family acetyltransferase